MVVTSVRASPVAYYVPLHPQLSVGLNELFRLDVTVHVSTTVEWVNEGMEGGNMYEMLTSIDPDTIARYVL